MASNWTQNFNLNPQSQRNSTLNAYTVTSQSLAKSPELLITANKIHKLFSLQIGTPDWSIWFQSTILGLVLKIIPNSKLHNNISESKYRSCKMLFYTLKYCMKISVWAWILLHCFSMTRIL